MMFQILRMFFSRMRDPPGVARVLVLLVAVLCYGTSGFLYFELPGNSRLEWSDGLWWSLATLTTVGYGDLSPATAGGRYLVALPLMLVGIGVLGYVLSLAAVSIVETRSREAAGLSTMKTSGHTILINFPNLDKVLRLLDELRSGGVGADVVLVDEDLAELPPELVTRGVRFVRGNPSRDETLTRAGLDRCELAVILCKRPGDPHSDHLNLAVTLAIERRRGDVRTVVECVDPEQEELFRKAGGDGIVCTSRYDAHFLGSEVLNPGVQDVIEELMSATHGQRFCFTPVEVGGGATFQDVVARCRESGHILIGLRRGRAVQLNVASRTPLQKGDELVTIGPGSLPVLRV